MRIHLNTVELLADLGDEEALFLLKYFVSTDRFNYVERVGGLYLMDAQGWRKPYEEY